MRLSRPHLIVLGLILLIVAAVFYATQNDAGSLSAIDTPESDPSRGRTSPELVSSAPASHSGSSEEPNGSSARGKAVSSRSLQASAPSHIEDLRNEIITLEKGMLKRQILMHALLKNGLIKDPDPEKFDTVISVPDTQDSVDEASALRAKDTANSYVEHKAGYLGQKALWKALKEKLRTAELAQKKQPLTATESTE